MAAWHESILYQVEQSAAELISLAFPHPSHRLIDEESSIRRPTHSATPPATLPATTTTTNSSYLTFSALKVADAHILRVTLRDIQNTRGPIVVDISSVVHRSLR